MRHVLLILLGLLITVGTASAQMHHQGNDAASGPEMMQQRIENYQGLDQPMRERMTANLRKCQELGLGSEEMAELFPPQPLDRAASSHMLDMQDRVLDLAARDLPTGPMLDKIAEGRMKNIPVDRLDHVLDQVQTNLETAHRHMMAAMQNGVTGPLDSQGRRRVDAELARCLWDGLQDGDLGQLSEHARMRARDGGCTMNEFVVASQAAVRFLDSGMDHEQAVGMAGDALMHGYSTDQMRTMATVMMGADLESGMHQQMLASMQGWVHDGMSWDEMTQHMMEGGWMGPADMMGPGGCNPMDNMGMSGPGHDGGMMGGGDHDHGGMGGGGDGMGGH